MAQSAKKTPIKTARKTDLNRAIHSETLGKIIGPPLARLRLSVKETIPPEFG